MVFVQYGSHHWGTLIEVGIGKIDSNSIPDIIAEKDRKRAEEQRPNGVVSLEVFY